MQMPPEFHPLINEWFIEKYGKPTAVQEAAWPLICRGEHVLALAPTGSGKTLTAFLAALSRFVTGDYPSDELSVLYVSPLKALNEDIRRNLLEPLAEIRSRFTAAALPFPEIRVDTRSGDTPQAERRRFLQKPPSILALTPESLAIILLNPKGRRILSSVKYLIMDEIHAVLGSKRGSFLCCQVARLCLVAGEFQRICLSATVKPPETAAAFAGGLRPIPGGAYEERPVRIVAPPSEKEIDFLVEFPDAEEAIIPGKNDRYGRRYTALTDYILARIVQNKTILVFTDSRRRAERISYLLNERDQSGKISFTHHGSLSKELRREVESALAAGKLPCVVATASLELGIDIGNVDEVILAGSPQSAAQTLQRIGRSGHGVGQISRGRLLPFTGIDLLAAAALSCAVEDREIEEIRPIENPLDVLSQIILALCAEEARNEDELYAILKGFYPFKTLTQAAYRGVLGMLTGRFEETRLRELKPRLYRDAETGELSAPAGTLPLLYMSGGVITNRGYYSMRLADGTKIGELDEEFVWERRLGDSFDFGSRPWRITAIGSEAVEVIPLDKSSDYAPFWKAEAAFRSPVLARRMMELLDLWKKDDNPANFPGKISETASRALSDFILSQKRAQGKAPLPGTSSLAIEIFDDPGTRSDSWVLIIHSFRGQAVNYPLSMALAQHLETGRGSSAGIRIDSLADDNSILLRLPRLMGEEPGDIIRQGFRQLGKAIGAGWEKPFRQRFEASGIFGALFREAAERALLLPKAGFGKRTPLWVMRQRSKRLFDAVSAEGDFPLTAEAWRSGLQDMFDIGGLEALIKGIDEGSITLSFFRTSSPSPFARDLLWKETNVLMYEYDERPDLRHKTGPARNTASLTDQVIAEALENPAARPPIPRDLADGFSARLRRELPGWAPEDGLSLSEWVKERVGIPFDEWETLRAVLPAELGEQLRGDPSLGGTIGLITRQGAAIPAMVHREWAEIWREDPLSQLGPWLRYEGPIPASRIAAVFGVDAAETGAILNALEDAGEIVSDLANEALICDRENLDFLLRLTRRKARPLIKERPVSLLTPFLALRQGLIPGKNGFTGQLSPWKSLEGLPIPVKLWETDLFPARNRAYTPEILDKSLREAELLWYGAGQKRVTLVSPDNFELFPPETSENRETAAELTLFKSLPPGFFDIPRDFWAIKNAANLDTQACAQALWEAVWQGLLSADSWEPVRRGIGENFLYASPVAAFQNAPMSQSRRIPRALRDRWRGGPPVSGNWFSLETPGDDPETMLMDEEELNRDRVRRLVQRWGLLCRPLLERELPALSWSKLLPAIRRLELAGELTAGRFFAGINSLQFASPAIAVELEAAETVRDIYWMNAADPASPCGLNAASGLLVASGLPAASLDPRLPPRMATSRICFRGDELAAVSRQNGKDLQIFVPPDDPDLPQILDFVKILKYRAVHPERSIIVETINGVTAASGEYAPILESSGFVRDRLRMALW
ncbi:DEAD/DEAH box helicase [Spirochaetia bacterium]|nr:DEAD/DEAH box helicase [Spirochaetia bacterium]